MRNNYPRGKMPVGKSFASPDLTQSPLLFDKDKLDKPPPLVRHDLLHRNNCSCPSVVSLIQFSVDGNQRQDGRLWNEIRNVSIQTGVVHDVTSSSYIELGNTKVLCSIIGPKHLSKGEDFSPEVKKLLL